MLNEDLLIMWSLEEGIEVARKIEPLVLEGNYHVALGGSVLHKGRSNKDLDIFLYQRGTEQECWTPDHVLRHLYKHIDLEVPDKPADHTKYGDKKIVYVCTLKGKRIDVFFLIK